MEQDWRLNGQERFLENAILYKVVFPDFWETAYMEKNEFYQNIAQYAHDYVARYPDKKEYFEGEKIGLLWHRHCDFCWDKATTNTECEFYCTKDMKYWVCKECFEDFQEKFNWTVKSFEE